MFKYIPLSSIILLLLFPSFCSPDISVNDVIALKGKETMISAETKGKFFAQGGKMVEFFINGKSIGKCLSGGDGIAYKAYTPLKRGLFHITVESGDEKGEGILLSLRKGEKIIFVDIEGSLFDGLFSKKPRKGSKKVIKELSERFPVVFLQTGLLGTKFTKLWLKDNGFVDIPVLKWRSGLVFEELSSKGFEFKAIIGKQSIIESAKEYENVKLLCFEEAEDAEYVKDWEDIRKKFSK